jgi:hypothetical protein
LRPEGHTRCGPGAYRPDPSAEITAPADLPPPASVPYSRHDLRHPCPRCGPSASRDQPSHRTRQEVGNLDGGWPRALRVTYAQPSWTKWRQDLRADLSALAPPGRQDPHRVLELAVRIGGEAGGPDRPARWHRWRAHRVVGPCATSQTWGEAGGKKAQSRMDTACLDGAWADGSGSVAADALSDGPFGGLSAVDNRCDTRRLDDV